MDLIQVADLRGKKRLDIPEVAGGWVEFYTDITAAFAEESRNISEGGDQKAQEQVGYTLLANVIADWNFADQNGKLAISVEAIKLLPSKIIQWLVQASQSILEVAQAEHTDQKKDLPVAS